MRLRVLSPSDTSGKVAYLWQDYWVKLELEKEFRKLGYEIMSLSAGSNVDIFLFGTWSPHSKFLSASNKYMWFYSHARLLDNEKFDKFHRQFRHIWLVSKTLFEKTEERIHVPRSMLLGATSKEYNPCTKDPEYDIVLMGNASKPRRVDIVKTLISLNKYSILIAGGGWNRKLTPEELGKISYVPYYANENYSDFYNNGKVTFFAGHPDMLAYGMVPPRIYDIYACSDCLCICELHRGIKQLSEWIPEFIYNEELIWKIDYYIENREESLQISSEVRKSVTEHTYKKVAKRMHEDIKQCPI